MARIWRNESACSKRWRSFACLWILCAYQLLPSSSKVGNGDVLAFQSMLEGWNVLQLYTWFHRLFYLGIIGICPALDDRKSHGQQLAEAKLVQAGCVGHSLQLREVKPRKPHSMLGTWQDSSCYCRDIFLCSKQKYFRSCATALFVGPRMLTQSCTRGPHWNIFRKHWLKWLLHDCYCRVWGLCPRILTLPQFRDVQGLMTWQDDDGYTATHRHSRFGPNAQSCYELLRFFRWWVFLCSWWEVEVMQVRKPRADVRDERQLAARRQLNKARSRQNVQVVCEGQSIWEKMVLPAELWPALSSSKVTPTRESDRWKTALLWLQQRHCSLN